MDFLLEARESMINIEIIKDCGPFWKQIHSNDVFSIYHSKIWKDLIENTFNHTSLYLAASEYGKLIDVLPIFLIRSLFMGKKLISTPYEGCNGGFTSSDVKVRKMLIKQILEHAQELNVQYVEIRSSFPISELKESGFIEKTPLLISEVILKDLDENWQMLSPKHRRNVRTAQKKGVTVEPASNVAEMKIFYKILANHYRDLGVPFFGKNFFIQIWEKLIQNNYASLLLAKLKEEVIGGHLLFFSGKTLVSKYAAVKKDRGFSKLYPSYALFWEGIRLGIEKNFKNFSLGVTGESNTGLLDFKSRFGSKTNTVFFYYYPIRGKIPDFGKYYGEYSLLKRIWRITPSMFTYPVGQKINEWIC